MFVFCTIAWRAQSHVFPLGAFVVSGQRIQARCGAWESLSVPGLKISKITDKENTYRETKALRGKAYISVEDEKERSLPPAPGFLVGTWCDPVHGGWNRAQALRPPLPPAPLPTGAFLCPQSPRGRGQRGDPILQLPACLHYLQVGLSEAAGGLSRCLFGWKCP